MTAAPDPLHLTAAEEAALPEHLRYPHAYRYNCDPLERRHVIADEVADRRALLAAQGFYQTRVAA